MPEINVGAPVGAFVDWLTANFGPLFHAISAVMLVLLDAVLIVLTAPSPYIVILVLVALALLERKWGFGLFTLLAFLLILAMGLWVEAMQTLALVVVATLIAVAIGIPVGIWAARSRRVSNVVRPILDFMQTLPVFVYLIPAVFFFGIGAVPGVVATLVFAIPPAVRLTELGIRSVDKEVTEAAVAFGAKPRQMLREVQLPLAMPSIMAGVNQTLDAGAVLRGDRRAGRLGRPGRRRRPRDQHPRRGRGLRRRHRGRVPRHLPRPPHQRARQAPSPSHQDPQGRSRTAPPPTSPPTSPLWRPHEQQGVTEDDPLPSPTRHIAARRAHSPDDRLDHRM